MRTRLLTPFALALLVACAGEAAEETATADDTQEYAADTNADVEAIAALADFYQTHFNMGHASMVADKYVEDGISWTANGAMLVGREAVAASMTMQIEMTSPEVEINQDEALIFGDLALARGTYSMSATAEGETSTNTGYWTTLSQRFDDGWMLRGLVTNLDSEDQMIAPVESGELPEGTGADLISERAEYYVTHYNMGHASMVADTYAEDAVVMASGGEAIVGREAILAWLTESTDAGAQVSLTPWAAEQLDADHVTGIGTYTVETPDGAVEGHFAALYELGETGDLMVKWLLTCNHPSAM